MVEFLIVFPLKLQLVFKTEVYDIKYIFQKRQKYV